MRWRTGWIKRQTGYWKRSLCNRYCVPAAGTLIVGGEPPGAALSLQCRNVLIPDCRAPG